MPGPREEGRAFHRPAGSHHMGDPEIPGVASGACDPVRCRPGLKRSLCADGSRPRAVEAIDVRVTAELEGAVLVEMSDVVRVLEMSHRPSYDLPVDGLAPGSVARGHGWIIL